MDYNVALYNLNVSVCKILISIGLRAYILYNRLRASSDFVGEFHRAGQPNVKYIYMHR